MELVITKYLKQHGLEKTLADFNLKHKEYPHKVLIKYDSIESNFTNEEVRDARGLVVEKGTWNVMSIAFRKFFNLGEGHAAPINWENARIFKKLDGTMIHVYHDYVTGDMCFGTTGTANGEGDVDNFHYTNIGGTFSDLFIHAFVETIERKGNIKFGENVDPLDKAILVKAWFAKYAGYTLAFELCTKYNIVVTPHEDSAVYLLGARKLDTLQEVSFAELEEISKDIQIELAPTISLNSDPEQLKSSFDGMSYREEGYVVCDYGTHGEFGYPRVKMKNPAYCAIHFFKDSTAFWRLIDIVRSGDDNVNEYKATFPGRGEEIEHLQKGWNNALAGLDEFTKIIGGFEEFIAYRKRKSEVLLVDKPIDVQYRGTALAALGRLGITKATEATKFSNEDLKSMVSGLSDKQARELRISIHADRGDAESESLRKNIAGRMMKWAVEKGLKKHTGFFFEYLNSECSSKRYMMEYDGKELYNELIKGYND